MKRFFTVLLALPLTALGCSGKDLTAPSGSGGGAGSAGVAGSAGSSSQLLSPTSITDGPELVGPSPVKCSGKPTPDPALVRTCLLIASCSALFTAPTSVSECIEKALPVAGAFPSCMVGAQTCAQLTACLGSGFTAGTDPCPPGSEIRMCQGTNVLWCDSVPRIFQDCAQSGGSCVAFSTNDNEKIDSADCAVAATCSTPSDTYVCNGTKRMRCQHGIGFGEDCAKRGLTCVDAPGGAVCRPAAAACQPGTGSCDGSATGSYCDADGRSVHFDCSPLGFICQPLAQSPQSVQCVSSTCSVADAASCFEECDGPLAYLCLGGERLTIDCRALGLRNCTLDTQASSGDRVRCGF